MASSKRVDGWLEDLRSGTAKKREAAVRHLAEHQPERAREVLLETLDTTRRAATRRVLGRCLHLVADAEAARLIAEDETLELEPDQLPSLALAVLYEDLRAALPSLDAGDAHDRLERLGAFVGRAHRGDEGAEHCRQVMLALLLAVIDDERLLLVRHRAARAIRLLDDPRGNEALLERWDARSGDARALDAFAAWVRLGCPSRGPGDDRAPRMVDALIAEVTSPDGPGVGGWDDAFVEQLIASNVAHLPDALVERLAFALAETKQLPSLAAAAGDRLVEVTHDPARLVELLDDPRLAVSHVTAAMKLVDGGPHGARAVLARSARFAPAVLAAALAALPPGAAFDLVWPRLLDERWYDVVLGAPTALRDPRWLDDLERLEALGDRGRSLLVLIARDPDNPSRWRAVDLLTRAAGRATDRLEKRHALHALGETGHPDATPALMAALDDPDLADGAPLVCTALGSCGDMRAIPLLEARAIGRYKPFVEAAIEAIRSRVHQIHRDVLLAACQDEDPTIADLARRARDGDDDAVVVLEDALRERGRL